MNGNDSGFTFPPFFFFFPFPFSLVFFSLNRVLLVDSGIENLAQKAPPWKEFLV